MQCSSMILALLGLVWAATAPAAAQQSFEVTLFGRKYNVLRENRAQTYRNGKTVVVPPFGAGNGKANLCFTRGADATQDRLFVVCPIFDDDTVTGHQFYLLTGTDANGVFSSSAATLTEFFGGSQNAARGGRPCSVMHLNDENTGVKVDRNLVLVTFAANDSERYYDLDSLDTDFQSAAVATRPQFPLLANAPANFLAYASGPGGTIVTFGLPVSANVEVAGVVIGVSDPRTGRYFPVLTNLGSVTSSATIPFSPDHSAHSAFLYAGDPAQGTGEYWLLASSSVPRFETDSTAENKLWRLRLRFPADLSAGPRGSIQAEVLGPPQELKGTPLHASDGGVFGMAVGREVAPGLRRLYFADWQGNLCTATPVP